jgi:hypothetical protein
MGFKSLAKHLVTVLIAGATAVMFWLTRSNPAVWVWSLPCLATLVVSWRMFTIQGYAEKDSPEQRDIGLTCGVLALSIAGGFYGLYAASGYVAADSRTSGLLTVLLWGLATYATGFGVGFLFGIPRVLQKDSSNSDISAGDYNQRVNTNLEQISDWLTKIIVGLGLVQLQQIPGFIKRVSLWVATSLPLATTSTLNQAAAFSTALIVYFCITGFLAGYLLTRLYLAGAFRRADRPPSTTVVIASPANATDDPSDKLRDFWAPGGQTNPENEVALIKWLGSQGLGDVPLAKFISGADYIAQRQQAVANFKL